MKFCIDDANIEKIRRICTCYPIDGVSTNPTILSRQGGDPYETLKEIRSIIGKDGELFVQTIGRDSETIKREAAEILRVLGDNTVVKIPVMTEGLRAIKELSAAGIRTLGTAVYTPMQGILAAKAGAEYIAPYVNRIDMLGFDGVAVALQIHEAIEVNGLHWSGLLAASFKNAQQVQTLIENGVKAVTVAPDIIDAMTKSPIFDSVVDTFEKDFTTAFKRPLMV